MEISIKNIKNILKNKKILESKLNLNLKIIEKRVVLEGDKLNEYIACSIIKALDANFPVDTAFLLSDENYMLEEINIKDVTKRPNLKEIKARIIGSKGRTLELLEELSDCYFRLNDNTVSIIGTCDNIKNAINALIRLIKGSKQSSVYSYLERQRRIIHPEDLGLKVKE